MKKNKNLLLPDKAIVIQVVNGIVANVFCNDARSVLICDNQCQAEVNRWIGTDNPKDIDADLAKVVKKKLKDLA